MQPIRLTLATFCGLMITIAAVAVIWNFIPALLWALILAIVVWPVFRLEQKLFKNISWLSALILTLLVAILIAIPVFLKAGSIPKITLNFSTIIYIFSLIELVSISYDVLSIVAF
jgi:predicted PurR-regulated permease PerM